MFPLMRMLHDRACLRAMSLKARMFLAFHEMTLESLAGKMLPSGHLGLHQERLD